MRSFFWNQVYRNNLFHGIESRSGTGSSIEATRNIRPFIENLIIERQIASLVDLPCGDLTWIRDCKISDLKYTGLDISAQLVKDLQNQLPGTDVRIFDAINQPLWASDLVLMRDFLVHLSFADIEKVLLNILYSGSRYLLVTNFPSQEKNIDIRRNFFGRVKWRPINLQLSPLNLPNPLVRCYENFEGNGIYQDKSLDLYLIADIEKHLKNQSLFT